MTAADVLSWSTTDTPTDRAPGPTAPADRPSRARRAARWAGRGLFLLSALNALVALGAAWAVNAERVGAHDLGLALFFAIGAAVSLTASLYAAPILAVLAAGAALVDRRAARWLVAAAAASAVPLAVLSWLDRR